MQVKADVRKQKNNNTKAEGTSNPALTGRNRAGYCQHCLHSLAESRNKTGIGVADGNTDVDAQKVGGAIGNDGNTTGIVQIRGRNAT